MKKKKYIDGWREHHKCDAMEKTFTKKMADIMQDNSKELQEACHEIINCCVVRAYESAWCPTTEKFHDWIFESLQRELSREMRHQKLTKTKLFSRDQITDLLRKDMFNKKIKIKLPLNVYYSKKKKFILNLNNYRNAHYRVLSIAKKTYSDDLLPEIQDLPKFTEPVRLTYTYYARSNRLLDISNPCSVIDKFACDALVKAQIIQDDDFKQIKEVVYKFGGVDKDDPRCELVIDVF